MRKTFLSFIPGLLLFAAAVFPSVCDALQIDERVQRRYMVTRTEEQEAKGWDLFERQKDQSLQYLTSLGETKFQRFYDRYIAPRSGESPEEVKARLQNQPIYKKDLANFASVGVDDLKGDPVVMRVTVGAKGEVNQVRVFDAEQNKLIMDFTVQLSKQDQDRVRMGFERKLFVSKDEQFRRGLRQRRTTFEVLERPELPDEAEIPETVPPEIGEAGEVGEVGAEVGEVGDVGDVGDVGVEIGEVGADVGEIGEVGAEVGEIPIIPDIPDIPERPEIPDIPDIPERTDIPETSEITDIPSPRPRTQRPFERIRTQRDERTQRVRTQRDWYPPQERPITQVSIQRPVTQTVTQTVTPPEEEEEISEEDAAAAYNDYWNRMNGTEGIDYWTNVQTHMGGVVLIQKKPRRPEHVLYTMLDKGRIYNPTSGNVDEVKEGHVVRPGEDKGILIDKTPKVANHLAGIEKREVVNVVDLDDQALADPNTSGVGTDFTGRGESPAFMTDVLKKQVIPGTTEFGFLGPIIESVGSHSSSTSFSGFGSVFFTLRVVTVTEIDKFGKPTGKIRYGGQVVGFSSARGTFASRVFAANSLDQFKAGFENPDNYDLGGNRVVTGANFSFYAGDIQNGINEAKARGALESDFEGKRQFTTDPRTVVTKHVAEFNSLGGNTVPPNGALTIDFEPNGETERVLRRILILQNKRNDVIQTFNSIPPELRSASKTQQSLNAIDDEIESLQNKLKSN